MGRRFRRPRFADWRIGGGWDGWEYWEPEMNEAQDIRFNIAEFLWGEHPINWPTPCQPRWWQFRQRRKMYEMQGVFGPLKTSNIEAFWRERRKGQSVYEDCGGYLLRCYRAMVGLPVEEPYTYADAAADLIADAKNDAA